MNKNIEREDSMEKVCVLIATYNPKKYFNEQIKSILNQKNMEVDIVIRDDGSSNKEFLKEFENYENITLIEGKNLGVANNIMTLITYAYEHRKQYNYFAYSDQDDIWLENKVLIGIEKLKNMDDNKPNLYYSNLKVVNENLEYSHYLFKKGVVKNNFGQSLSQVFCFACTCIFNFRMVEKLTSIDIKNMGFDTLIYYVAILFGNIYYDDNSYILYRQHGDNVSGPHDKGVKHYFRKIKEICSNANDQPYKKNALFLRETFKNEISNHNLELLEILINYDRGWKFKFKLIFNKEIKVGYYPKEIFNFFRIILNIY